MYRVKIFGAGSIGNHLAHAARQMGWSVMVCDIDDQALERMKKEIYPARYEKWDDSIQLYNNCNAPKGEFDFIFIGTPPDLHLKLAFEALNEKPRVILIEKPLCPPSLALAQNLYKIHQNVSTKIYVGYDHVVGKAIKKVEELLAEEIIGCVQTIDVEFREHWGGIFAAHPWLNGPADSYLGFWDRGGGASGEHSHAINMWQHLAHFLGEGRVVEVNAMMKYITVKRAVYDSICLMELKTEKGLIGRVVQDVLTTPARKIAKIQGTNGSIAWINGYNSEGDAIIIRKSNASEEVLAIRKTRPDDFLQEMIFIDDQLKGTSSSQALDLTRGLDTMLVVAAAHRAEKEKCRMRIDYKKGYISKAILPCYPK